MYRKCSGNFFKLNKVSMRIIKIVIISFFVFSSCFVQAQIGIGFSGEYGRLMERKPVEHVSITDNLVRGVSLNVFYDINYRFQIVSGLKLNQSRLNFRDESPTSSCEQLHGEIDYSSTYVHIDRSFTNLELPLSIRIRLFGDQNHIYLKPSFGVGLNVVNKTNFDVYFCQDLAVNDRIRERSDGMVLRSGCYVGYETKVLSKVKGFFELGGDVWLTNQFSGLLLNYRDDITPVNFSIRCGLRLI